MIPFDVANAPLKGLHLIEAGAGTGKTYTIATLFLRLIVEQGLAVDQVLVVTYTNAAAEELKTRIRRRLVWAKNELARDTPGDPLLAMLSQRVGDRRRAHRRVSDALVDFDRSAIFTIHGFCQRVLHHFAFETGHLFACELVQDAQPFIQEAADDFWRRNISRAPAELVQFILDQVKGPESLANLFLRRRSPLTRVIPPAAKPPLTAIRFWREIARQITADWPQCREEVAALLSSPGLNGRNYGVCTPPKDKPGTSPRQIVVAGLVAAMDQWRGSYPPFGRFDRFGAGYLARSTKKNQEPPRHPFFDLCGEALSSCNEMAQQMAAYWRYLKVRLLAEFHQRLAVKKRTANIMFFDDLLLQVHAALADPRQPQLAQAVRMKYQAALVDEFQDTDALQYEIFIRLFGDERYLFFMIGDPKQAIYSFRGADIFSYLRARETAGSQYTLTSNYRSTPALVKALNTLFGSRPRPFGYEKIPYEPAVAAHDDFDPDTTPFRLWYLTREEEGDLLRPMAQQEAVQRIVAAVAEEIVGLLSTRRDPFSPEDIAVLTRTHRQAQRMKIALARRGVPAVLHSAGSVFGSPEAGQMAIVLAAVANPADPRGVRAALSSDLLGVPAGKICDYMEKPDRAWESRWARFETYHHTWLQHGFHLMFSQFMAEESVRPRLLALPDGERRLTNVLHLSELLHQAAIEHQMGPEGLLKWLAAQRQQLDEGEEAQKLRLESDARAVRIITTHKSKGLQFEVVFCPFTWAAARVDDNAVSFHDPGDHDRLTLAIGPGVDPFHQRLALEEALTENLRLMYVALTRARRRCYLAWGCIKGTELSAPAYLLHAPMDGFESEEWTTALRRKMAAMTDTLLVEELKNIGRCAEGTIAVEPPPQPSKAMYVQAYPSSGALQRREFTAKIDHRWRTASFSAMTAQRSPEEDDRADRDTSATASGDAAGQIVPDPDGLFAFPKGARAGLFFHDLLEHCDFGNPDAQQRSRLVARKLEAHGFESRWQPAVECLLAHLAATSLPVISSRRDVAAFRVSDIATHRRVNEMEFYFPLRPVTPEQLRQTIREGAGRFISEYARPLERLTFAPMQGFMKGYMDMVFEYGGRYYLVDWKSNHLGGTWDDYTPENLKIAMAHDYYFLQYYLYVVALDQWLCHRVDGYKYDQHFGGVYYIFLRGIQGAGGMTGVYHDIPDPGLVAALKRLLIDQPAELSIPAE